jgi:formylglycine-generating enzyme required for sulfatase activity
MGKEGGKDNPRHKVYLNSYYIDKLPITNIQYEKFVRETKYQSEGDWRRYYTTGASNYPVTCVTWKDAVEYLNWAEKRLPTEAEWEKAATGTEGRLYPWGNTWDPNKCNNLLMNKKEFIQIMCNMEDKRGTIPVGSITSGISPYGVEDLAGNSWEWCFDWYDKDYYYHGPENNPQGPHNGKFKVTRGGFWKANYPYFFECSFRAWLSLKERMGYCGIRGVKDPD